MTPRTVVVEALRAAYGDSILVTCSLGNGEWRLLVDTGTDECWPSLKERLQRIPPGDGGKRHIDLVVISHIDHDHIGAAHALFDDQSLGLSFGDIWFNAPTQTASRGVEEGQSLASLLGASRADLPWNMAWGGQHAVVGVDQPFVELPYEEGGPRITLLSPTPKELAKLFKVWDAELKKLGKESVPVKRPAVARGLGVMDLVAMAGHATPLDHAPANGSSIAFLLEHGGHSLLLSADAYAPVLVGALTALAAHRGVSLPWQFDVFKLSHHGSSANITVDLFRAVQAQHYIVSTNGAIFGHPDDEAIARAVVGGGAQRTFSFNYHNDHTEKWNAPELRERYGYSVSLPERAEDTVLITLGAH